DRVEASRQKERSLQMLAATEEITHVGSWEWDIEKDLVRWSAELFRIFGLDPANGEPPFSDHGRLYPPSELARLQEAVDRTTKAGGPYDLELVALRADGTQFDCRARGRARIDASGKVTHLYGSLQDISEQKAHHRELLESRERAERASQAKTLFLGSLSHELRTPMNAIMGMTDLAMEQSLPTEARDYLQVARDASDHLLEIIKDLLDSAVMEQGRIRLVGGPFSLKRAILRSVAMARIPADAKRLPIRFTFDERIPDWLEGDSKRLSQIVTNLMDNAIRYTARGEIRVAAERIPDVTDSEYDTNRCRFALTVSDTGDGIAPQDQARIFEKFVQVRQNDNRLVRQNQGTGLGLHIVKSLVEAMGGEVTLTSQPNKGSEFRIELSLPVSQGEGNHPRPESSSIQVKGDLRILMAEDNAINAIVQRAVLEQARHSVTIVEDGKEVLEKLRDHDFDLILLDLEMPIMDGFETSERIRAGEAGETKKTIPIVAITAHVLDEIKEHCQRSGMDGFITKPIDANALNQTLDNIISSKNE
ncbi:MAG: response regulator, partial [Leptospiraceae bacterium]|nr:response regulator [Leptospiraceae bacterium]